ncbi:MAG: hemolysin III family protein [Bacteroidaceae bacterium]|nr:hemolysin III family protein [Bacteroidaceae bacterium]
MYIGEKGNTWTHLVGAVFALTSMWVIWPAVNAGWQMAMGVIFFISGMFLMFLSSTIYHWLRPGVVKRAMRKVDHISIYVMIACSYSPICLGVVGGWLGWTVFGLLWAVVIGGTFYKIYAIGKWPKLSLALYLVMGWSVLLIAKPVMERLEVITMLLLLAEGLLYTSGTYFFAHDSKPHFHAVWHVFVLLGAMAHWLAVLTIVI